MLVKALLRQRIDERMKFCVAEIAVLTPEERHQQCPKCKSDTEIQKYILTDKGWDFMKSSDRSFWGQREN